MSFVLAFAVAIMLQKVSNASTGSDEASVAAGLGTSTAAADGQGPLPTLPPGIAPIPIATVTVPVTVAPTSTATTLPPKPVKPKVTLPPVPPGSPRDYARQLLPSFGWSDDQFSCLDPLWTKESGWNPLAANPRSAAYGIPQANPGSKMAAFGPDWQTNYMTQIRWGLNYISGRYSSPCGAWSHSQSVGWY
jgi:hypothetical protein